MEDSNSNCAVDMTSKTINAEENKAKKMKRLDGGDSEPEPLLTGSKDLLSFRGYKIKRVLNDDPSTKTIFLEADFEETKEKAVLILEKEPFAKDSIQKLFTEHTSLIQNFTNDIYKKYQAYPKAELNPVQTIIVQPATEKHITKYLFQPLFVVKETPEIYQNVVLPHLNSNQFSMQWVYNLLEHKEEAERIIFEDSDPEVGFILAPDPKWNEKDISSLYVLAICHCRNVKSLRDLDASRLSLLKNMYEKSVNALESKYKISKHKLRVYIHYQPSYYHFHIHFSNVEYMAPGINVGRAHLLSTVINNLELYPEYYKNALLEYSVKAGDPLYIKLKEHNVCS